MLLTITSTAPPATDLGYLLHKHPDRNQAMQVASGAVHVFYPEADEQRCTAALLLEVDPVRLVRGRSAKGGGPEGQGGGKGTGGGPEGQGGGKGTARVGFTLGQYVNDRPYAASSLLAVALASAFRTAMRGRCDARPELAETALPLELTVPALPCRGGPDLARALFEPLAWQVGAEPVPVDPDRPDQGDSRYVSLRLVGEARVADALNHLYVLLPVLDDAKHYWVTTDEVDKLVRAGTGWLAVHPERELIARRYLAHQRHLAHDAVARLAEIDDIEQPHADDAEPVVSDTPEGTSLARQRLDTVLGLLRNAGAGSVVDLGCGEGRLLAELAADPAFTQVTGVDVSPRRLARAEQVLRLDRMPDAKRERVKLLRSALTYRDARLRGYDAAVLMEVVEHVDPVRLPALADTVFGDARPGMVVVTTPNAEYNVRFPGLPPGTMRHPDHRFEWTRAEFAGWGAQVAETYGYTVTHHPVGTEDPEVGPPTQAAVFQRGDEA